MLMHPNVMSLRDLRDARRYNEYFLDHATYEPACAYIRTLLAGINAEIARRIGTYNHATGYREARR